MSVIGTGIGVDNVEIALVEAYTVHAFDLESSERLADATPLNFIRIGTSAGVQDNIDCGTLAIANYGLGLDNAGMYYDHPAADGNVTLIEERAYEILKDATSLQARFREKIIPYASRATPSVVTALVNAAKTLEIDHVVGVTAATPGFYGASGRYIDGLVNTVPGIKTKLAALDVAGNRVVNMEMESSLIFHVAGFLGCPAGTICPIISKPDSSTAILDYAPSVEKAIDVALAAMLEISQGPNLQK